MSVESTTIEISGSIAFGGVVIEDLLENERLVWSFAANAGDVVSISLESADFDAYLELLTEDGETLDVDDDGGETGNNSLIEDFSITETGTYLIVVRSYRSGQFGEFTLSLIEE